MGKFLDQPKSVAYISLHVSPRDFLTLMCHDTPCGPHDNTINFGPLSASAVQNWGRLPSLPYSESWPPRCVSLQVDLYPSFYSTSLQLAQTSVLSWLLQLRLHHYLTPSSIGMR